MGRKQTSTVRKEHWSQTGLKQSRDEGPDVSCKIGGWHRSASTAEDCGDVVVVVGRDCAVAVVCDALPVRINTTHKRATSLAMKKDDDNMDAFLLRGRGAKNEPETFILFWEVL